MAFAPKNRARLQATFAVAGSSLLWWRLGGRWPLVAVLGTGGLALLAWLAPERYQPVQRTLDRLTHALLTALTWLVLGAVYFGVFTPLRLARALRGRDPLQPRRRGSPETYLVPLPPAAAQRFDRQF